MAQRIYLTRRNEHFHYPHWFFISSPQKQRKVFAQDQLKPTPMCCTPTSSSKSHWQPNTRRSHRRGTGSAERTLRSHTHDTDFPGASSVLIYFTYTWSAHSFWLHAFSSFCLILVPWSSLEKLANWSFPLMLHPGRLQVFVMLFSSFKGIIHSFNKYF